MPNVKAVCGWVKSNIKSSFSIVDELSNLSFIGYLGNPRATNSSYKVIIKILSENVFFKIPGNIFILFPA